MFLIGDIGGTKTHLALFASVKDKKPFLEETFPSPNYASLLEILQIFSAKHPEKLQGISLGVAGPVVQRRCEATNLPWVIDAREIGEALHVDKVCLLNDLESLALGVPALSSEDLFVVNKGVEVKGSNLAIIAAGTGLGEAGLFWGGERYLAVACEGGHADFAPSDELEVALWSYLKKRYGHASYERVLSGHGLADLMHFLIEEKKEKPPAWMAGVKVEDLPKSISEKALKKECALSMEALQRFVSIYGGEAGNLCLKYLALGGVYIGGGIALKILPAFSAPIFMESFNSKGRMKKLLERVPVFVILNPNTHFFGALKYLESHP